MDTEELEENWRRACRENVVTNRYPEPGDAKALIEAVSARVRGAARPPDSILRGLASGFASTDYEASGEARYLQLALLVSEASKHPHAELRAAVGVLSVIGQAAVGVLVEAWRGEAELDALTGLGNRRKLESLVANLASTGGTFEYASIDVDGLKRVNDSEGHAAGDAMLRELGERLAAAAFDHSGHAFRYGGDEYGILLSVREADTLRSVLGGLEIQLASAGIHFSWGVATWPNDDEDVDTVIVLADRRMYDAKRAKSEE